MPDFVREALEEHGLARAYEARPWYQQQGYLRCIARPKREETRQRHLAQMFDELRRGDVCTRPARRHAARSTPSIIASARSRSASD